MIQHNIYVVNLNNVSSFNLNGKILNVKIIIYCEIDYLCCIVLCVKTVTSR